jgi:hypothetical protein
MSRALRMFTATAAAAGAVMALVLGSVAPSYATGPIPPETNNGSKPAVFRNGVWYLRTYVAPVSITTFGFGRAGDIPVMGDWNGDGSKTAGVVRGRLWYLRNSNSKGPSNVVFSFGRIGDVPVVGDWDGDGDDTPGVVRCVDRACTSRQWFVRNSLTGGATTVTTFGGPGTPMVADWDNLGGDTPGMVDRNSVWSYTNAFDSTVEGRFRFGTRGDKPVVGSWNIDSQTGPGLVRNAHWLMGRALAAGGASWSFHFGRPTDQFLTWE